MGDGHCQEADLPLRRSANENVVWKTKLLPGIVPSGVAKLMTKKVVSHLVSGKVVDSKETLTMTGGTFTVGVRDRNDTFVSLTLR
jgi:hypothetical protein